MFLSMCSRRLRKLGRILSSRWTSTWFCCDGGVCPNPLDARGIALQSDDGILLMLFYLLLGRAIEVTRVSGVSYWEYLNTATRWSPEIWHETYEDPPRHLVSITSG